MKFTRFILVLFSFTILLSLPISKSYAQEETADAEPTVTENEDTEESEKDAIKQKIDDLKDRLATRVAELTEANKRAFFGIVKSQAGSLLTLSYEDSEQPVATDEATLYESQDTKGKRTKSSPKDINAGQTLVVFGTLDIDQKTILADSVVLQTPPIIESGLIKEVDTSENTFTVNTSNGTLTLDYEISTRCTVYENEELDTCGLSKLQEGDKVFLRLTSDEEDIARGTAVRVLLIPSAVLTQNGIESPTPTTMVVSPTTTSE